MEPPTGRPAGWTIEQTAGGGWVGAWLLFFLFIKRMDLLLATVIKIRRRFS